MIGIFLAALAIASSCSPAILAAVPFAIWVVGAIYAVTEDDQRELEREQLRARFEHRQRVDALLSYGTFRNQIDSSSTFAPPKPPPTSTPGPGQRMYR